MASATVVSHPPSSDTLRGAGLAPTGNAPRPARYETVDDFWRNNPYNGDKALELSTRDYTSIYGGLIPPDVTPGVRRANAPQVVGGIEDELYFCCLAMRDGSKPAYGWNVLTSDLVHITCESDSWFVRPEIVTKPAVIGSEVALAAIDDVRTLRKAFLRQDEPISLRQFAEAVNPLLHSPLHAAQHKKKDDSDYGTYSPDDILVWHDPQQHSFDIWRQETFGVSLYVYSNPGLLHFYSTKLCPGETALGSRTPDERGNRVVARVDFQEYPVRRRLARMYEMADRARSLVNTMQADLAAETEAGSPRQQRTYEKLTGFMALIGQWLTYPTKGCELIHWIAKDRVLVLPHTSVHDIFSQCLSAKDHAFVADWTAQAERKGKAEGRTFESGLDLLIDRILDAFELSDTALVAGSEAGVDDVTARDFLKHQLDPTLGDGAQAKAQQTCVCGTIVYYPPNRDPADEQRRRSAGKAPIAYPVAEMRVAHGDITQELEELLGTNGESSASAEDCEVVPAGLVAHMQGAVMVNPDPEVRRAVRELHRRS